MTDLANPDPAAVARDLLTVRDFLRHALSRFREGGLVFGHGASTALDDAAFLILESLHLPIDDLGPWLDARLMPAERLMLAQRIAERVTTRRPTPYIVGRAYLQGVPFHVDERVIVPRSYLAELIASDLFEDGDGLLADLPPVSRVLDLCTGSGCLAVLAAMRFPDARVDAVDISADALEVARLNLDEHGLTDRIALLRGDLFGPVAGRRYELILANPPYVSRGVVEAFPPEYAAEPELAHLGGEDGFDLVRRLVAGAGAHLAPGGALLCEIGEDRELLEAEFPELPFLWLDSAESEGEVLLLRAEDLGA
jgi:ribosomal protein L3 glutamine methyltransferase